MSAKSLTSSAIGQSKNKACARLAVLLALFNCLGGLIPALAADDPFGFELAWRMESDDSSILTIIASIPANHLVYAETFAVEAPSNLTMQLLSAPEPVEKPDVFSGETKAVFSRDFQAVYHVRGKVEPPLEITVRYMGCSGEVCFMPVARKFALFPQKTEAGLPAVAEEFAVASAPLFGFVVVARGVGYMSASDFLRFLNGAFAPTAETAAPLWPGSWLFLLGAVLLGGLMLNFTPCVLPMIPVNIAIIGAGSSVLSVRRRFVLGAWYGAGIAAAYGVLGLPVVLGGATFGVLNASPVFNFAVAVLFAVLALAMFDVFQIDFSRWQGRLGSVARGGGIFMLFGLGALAALLAGACVAPVVLSVLLLAADLFAKGRWLGLLLPFGLGVGMALPWPFAAAGLAMLPKPGAWMMRVKIGFGVLILGLSVYYFYLGLTIGRIGSGSEHDDWLTDIPAALALAEREQKPVLLDFYASWCKSCHAMDVGPLRDERVRKNLERFVKVKFQAEQPDREPARTVLKEYDVRGFPTYLILQKQGADGDREKTD